MLHLPIPVCGEQRKPRVNVDIGLEGQQSLPLVHLWMLTENVPHCFLSVAIYSLKTTPPQRLLLPSLDLLARSPLSDLSLPVALLPLCSCEHTLWEANSTLTCLG